MNPATAGNGATTSPDSLTATHAALRDAQQATAERNKPLAVQRIDAIEATLGHGFSPARLHLRAAQATVDISRWDLVAEHLAALGSTLNPHSSPEG